jgi:hypothetical protein
MVRSYAEDFPKYTRGVSHYQKIDGQLTPVPKDNTQVKDEINPKAVLLQMEHTAWYIRDKITVADIQKKRRMWKQHFQDYQSSTPKTWIQKLRKMENTEDPIELAVLNQLVDVSLGTLDRAELALTEKQIGAYGRIRESRRRAYSKFDFNYDNPHDETQRLIKTKEGRKLLRAVQKISDAISDNVSGIIDQTLTELQEKTEFGSFVETFKKETKAKCRNAIQG